VAFDGADKPRAYSKMSQRVGADARGDGQAGSCGVVGQQAALCVSVSRAHIARGPCERIRITF